MQENTIKNLFQLDSNTTPSQVAELLTNDKINLPRVNFDFNKEQFFDFLLTAISLTPREKIFLMLHLPNLSQDKIAKLIAVFQKEKQNLLEMHKGKQERIDQLKEKSLSEIKELIAQVKNSNSLGILHTEILEEEKY